MTKLGRYTLIEELGRGSFAVVHRAHDSRLKREVALKVLNPILSSDPTFVQLFLREARAAAGLKHPNIVTIYDADESNGNLYISMELIEGSDLRRLIIKEGPQPIPLIVNIIDQVAAALDHAHRRNLVHRDVKSANIIISEDGKASLTDFGLVWAVEGSEFGSSLSLRGRMSGTLEYMSPEHIEGNPATPRSDLYSLGIVAYEMVTGRVPFRASTPLAIMRMQAEKPPPDPRELRGNLLDGIYIAILTALEKNPIKRHSDVLSFATELRMGAQLIDPSRDTDEQDGLLRLNIAPGVDIRFVCVPAGEFIMGSSEDDQDASDREKPQQKIYLGDYWIGEYPVTVAQYAAFIKATGYKSTAKLDFRRRAEHPVTEINWYDANAFCQWVTRSIGTEVRLPTEAEWEKAARGIDGQLFPWGDEEPDANLCNYRLNIGDTTLVGSYGPQGDSPYGCSEMAGNVGEWTSNEFKRYSPTGSRGVDNMSDRNSRVIRGGSFFDTRWHMRCACRIKDHPESRNDDIGFRVFANPPKPD